MLLVDANNWVWRSYFAGGKLSSRGRPTGMLHVGLSMLAALPDLVPKQAMVFLWDGGESWRKQVMPEYKGSRDGGSEERKVVYKQIDIFKTVLTAIGIRQVECNSLEADDLAGIFTELLRAKQYEVVLVSSDKDWYQLLGEGVIQLRGWKGKKADWWTAERVEKEYGVAAADWPKYLALVGDKGDNIPKALPHGKGPKVALKVLSSDTELTPFQQGLYERNLKVTTILRRIEGSRLKQGIIEAQRSKAGWMHLSDVLSEYELFQLWGERKRLWAVGGWR